MNLARPFPTRLPSYVLVFPDLSQGLSASRSLSAHLQSLLHCTVLTSRASPERSPLPTSPLHFKTLYCIAPHRISRLQSFIPSISQPSVSRTTQLSESLDDKPVTKFRTRPRQLAWLLSTPAPFYLTQAAQRPLRNSLLLPSWCPKHFLLFTSPLDALHLSSCHYVCKFASSPKGRSL